LIVQHAVPVVGGDAARVDRRRQRETAAERAVATFDAVELLLLHLASELLFALDSQRALVDRDVDVLAGHVGQFGLQHQFMIAVLIDIHRWQPGA
jgi:hypothetical protein